MQEKKYIVPMSSPDINADYRQAVLEVLKTPYLSIGPKIVAFEQEVKKYIGTKEAIGVSSGTTGLHLCVRAANIQRGDLVLTTPFSFVSSANVILFEQAIPVFVDVDAQSGNLDTALAAQAVEYLFSKDERKRARWLPRACAAENGVLKAMISVDVFGQPADYDSLVKVGQNYKLSII